MLKEVEIKQALESYVRGNKEVTILLPDLNSGRKVMYSLSELFKDAIFLMNEATVSTKSEEFSSHSEAVKTLADKAKKANLMQNSSKEAIAETKENKSDEPKEGKRGKVDIGKLFALHNAGWNAKDIAEELNCSLATVYNNINKLK